MSKEIKVKLVRSDGESFVFGDCSWGITNLDGFGDLSVDVVTSTFANTDGSYLMSETLKEVDRTVTACVRNVKNQDVQRELVKEFFRSKDTYKLYVTYGGKCVWQECILHKLQLSTDRYTKLYEIKFTMLFLNRYWLSLDNFGKDIANVVPGYNFPYISTEKGRIQPSCREFSTKLELFNTGEVDSPMKIVITLDKNSNSVYPWISVNGYKIWLRVSSADKNKTIVIDRTSTPPTLIDESGNSLYYALENSSNLTQAVIRKGTNIIEYGAYKIVNYELVDVEDSPTWMHAVIEYNQYYTVI